MDGVLDEPGLLARASASELIARVALDAAALGTFELRLGKGTTFSFTLAVHKG
jgi:hypothetical protein